MVLESLLAELLNRYIGDYVQNLDPKQLNLGIWGGDIKLSNLLLKESALNDLDLPFKITHGRLSSLVLKVPWKNLYSSTVKVEVGGLFLVAVPNIGLQYNREKEEKDALEGKQRELRRLEDVKKLQKNAAGDAGAGQGDSFVEKMATQIIKNLQVDVTDIHIRFEDHFSNPAQPFACGVTLSKLQFVTTEQNWLNDQHVVNAAKFVYKLVNLEALSMYWNPIVDQSASFHSMSDEKELTSAFSQHIASKERKVPSLSYILEPIHFTCNLRINPKPELDESNFAIPKIDLRLTLESLALSLTRQQYEGLILFADALDTITLKSRYRKYNPPQHPIRQQINARDWWQYAQRCILDGEVKPRLRGWKWENIKAHRAKLRRYRYLYVQKLLNAGVKQGSSQAEEEVERLERELSTFNLVIMRQQADADVQRLAPTLPPVEPQGWWGWMTGKGKGNATAQLGEGDLEKKLAEIMTPEEKGKLYSAIGYREGAAVAIYPTTFVENRFDFLLKELAVTFVDGKDKVMSLALNNVQTQIEQRPSAEAIKIKAVVQKMQVDGVNKDHGPIVIPTAQGDQGSALLDVWYETKPLNSRKGFLVKVMAAPVRAVYDAQTVNAMAAFFRPPRALQLKQLQVTAAAKFQELRESSTAGLRFALESRLGKEVELDVHLHASHLIIPERGVFSAGGAKLVLDLGDFRVRNIEEDRSMNQGSTDLVKLEASLYDKYSVSLSNVQILFVPAGAHDNEGQWMSARQTGAEKGMTPLHILQPLSCDLQFQQCIVHNDPKRPMIRLVGKLPSAAVDMTEARLMELSRLALSIPLPESPPVEQQEASSQHSEAFKQDMQRQAMSMARSNKDLKIAEEMFLSQSLKETLVTDEGYQESIVSSEGEAMATDDTGDVFFDAVEDEAAGATKRHKASHTSLQPSPSLRSAALKDINFTTLQLQFTVDDISLRIYRGSKVEEPFLSLQLATIILEMNQRTFDMEVGLALADLIIDYTPLTTTTSIKAAPIRMLQRHRQSEHDKGFLLRMDYHKVDVSSPDFHTVHNQTKQKFNADFLGLDVVLDRQGLIELKHFAQQLQEQLESFAAPANAASLTLIPEEDEDLEVDMGYSDVLNNTTATTTDKTPKSEVEETGIIDMDIRAQCHYLTLSLLIQGRKELAYVALRDISAKIWTTNKQMEVQAQLKRIKLNYPLSSDNLYQQIVRTLSDEVLSLHYIGYQDYNKDDVEGRDMDVQLSLGAVQIVFLNKFVTEISSFFAGFETAQAKLKEVGTNAAESAKQTVQQVYNEAVRIKLKVAIRAPIVIIPQHSRSINAMLADLGTLLLSNSFHFVTASNGQRLVMDQLLLNFAAIKLSRVVMGGKKQQEVLKEFALLSQPQAMEMTVRRNLSGTALPDVPSMAITGGLKSLEMQLSSVDYGVVMAVLAENFAEPTSSIVTVTPAMGSPSSAPFSSHLGFPPLERSQSRLRNLSTSRSHQNSSPAMSRKPLPPTAPLRVIDIKVDFSIGDISARLYLAELPDIRAADGHQSVEEMQALCQAQIVSMEAQVQMFSDNTMTVLATLANITLDDLRAPGSVSQGQAQKFRMLERKESFGPSDTDVSSNMFHMLMQQQANGDKTIDITIAHILANLSLSFYLGLLQFIAPPAAQEQKVSFDISELGTSVNPSSNDNMSSTAGVKRQVSRSGLSESTDAKLDASMTLPAIADRPLSIMQVNVVLKEPEIVLIEDLSVSDSRVLVVKTAATFKMTVTPDETVMAISCLALQAFLSTYQQRHDLLKEILMPVDIGMQSKRPFGKEQKMAVTLGPVRLTISPVVVQTIMGVLAGMTSSSDDQLQVQQARDHSGLWQLQPADHEGLWFLNDDSGTDMLDLVVERAIEQVVDDVLSSGDQLSLDTDSLVVVLESTFGNRTLPMILAELKFSFMVDDFSRKLSATGTVELSCSYYNEQVDFWEPLLEPIEDIKNYRTWQAQIEARKNFTADEHIQQLARVASSHVPIHRENEVLAGSMSRSSSVQSSMGSEAATEALKRTAAMTVSVSSMDPLQLTVTKTTLDVLSKVAESFTSAISQSEQIKVLSFSAPYAVINDTGVELTLSMTGTLSFVQSADKTLHMAPGDSVDLLLAKDKTAQGSNYQLKPSSVLQTQEQLNRVPPSIRISFGSNADKYVDVLVKRAESRFYLLENVSDQSKPYRLVVEVKSEMGHKQVTLRSPLQVNNLLPTAMTVFVESSGQPMIELASVLPGHRYNLPMTIIQNSEVAALRYRPTDYGHLTTSEAVPVSQLIALAGDNQAQQQKSMRCPVDQSQTGKFDQFYFTVFCNSWQIRYSNAQTYTPNSKHYQVSLSPIYSILNFLPPPASLYIQMEDAMEEGVSLSPGTSASVCNAKNGQGQMNLALLNLGNKPWVGAFLLNVLTEEILPVTMNRAGQTLTLGIRHVKDQGTHFISVYSPVWIINKTGLELAYKDPVIKPPAPSSTTEMPIMFGGRTLTGKKKISVKVVDSEWSDYVSLDTLGSSGMMPCRGKDGSLAYEFGINIKASATVLSRIFIITPYYVFSNASEVVMIIREDHPDAKAVKLPAKSTVPFWPQYLSKYACITVEGTEEATVPFSYSILQTLLLRLNNTYGGVYVQTQISDSNVTCILNTYQPGTASALLVNDTRRCDVQFRQADSSVHNVLPAQQQQLWTWPLPTSVTRQLVWTVGGEGNKPLDLNKDDAGLCYMADGRAIFWVAFLDGLQRVLLFTDRRSVAQQCGRSLENEMSNLEVELRLSNIGLSVVDNLRKKEVLYLGLVSPGPVWMGRKVGHSTKKAKAMSADDWRYLESAYQQYLRLKESDKGRTFVTKIITAGDVEVTFDASGPKLMTKPKVREVSREHQPGMWCRLTTSDHHTQFHLKLHKLQLDNPTLGSRYQVVLYPVPLPSTTEYKPFAETSVVIRNAENSAIVQYKLVSVLIQEFQLLIDQAFINNMLQMFSAEDSAVQERSKMLDSFRANDLQEVARSLQETVARGLGEERQAYYERLLLQPIKIHLSFSLNANSTGDKRSEAPQGDFITLFVKSIGVSVTEANDVVFKFGAFQRDYRFISQKQALAEAQHHFVTQGLKQIYMLVLGLEILGNPFGLVRGITDGVKDLFYEPYLGAVEGPEEFLSGLGAGIKNFVGGTLGGTVGAVSRVTGTLGKAMAALSFDQEFQQQRQADMNRGGTDFATGMVSSAGHFASGVVSGVTGVFSRPIEGAKEEGASGFMKGLGKGLVGLIARPTTGLIDSLSGSLSTIERSVKGDTTISWIRTPRFIASDGIIQPYNQHQADGGLIFRRLKNGEYTKTDEYITHLVTSRDRRYILLLTNRRVLCLEKGDFTHDWDTEWSFPIEQMPDPPSIDEKGLCLYINDHETGGLFNKAGKKSKRVFVEDRDAGAWFCTKVTALWRQTHQRA